MSNRSRTVTLAHRAARTDKMTPFRSTTRSGRVSSTTTTGVSR